MLYSHVECTFENVYALAYNHRLSKVGWELSPLISSTTIHFGREFYTSNMTAIEILEK